MVKICDAIMGSGKTSAAISYINSHPDKKFLYITPYVEEAKRVKDSCPDADFVEPSNELPRYARSKSVHSMALIKEGRNIASTHKAMEYYTQETFEDLREKGYSVIIDEEINILRKVPNITNSDIKMMEECGYIRKMGDNTYERTDTEYKKGKFTGILLTMNSRPLILLNGGDDDGGAKKIRPWYCMFSSMLFQYVDDIIVLTYLFENSEMEYFLKMNNVEYKYIGIRRTDNGGYEFSDRMEYIPEYTNSLKDKIHINDHEKLHTIGNKKNALSINWYKTHPDEVEQLRKNICNYFRNRIKLPGECRMCGTYKNFWDRIKDKGYTNSDVVFCEKSTNKYRDRRVLVYPVNIFANTSIVLFYNSKGFSFDNDRYALSVMVQWIWRSAIRDGKDIWIYVPSKRMRDLLIGWIDKVSNGGG